MPPKPIKVGITGTHCSGKTRLVRALAREWALSGGYKCGVVSEVARQCPLPIGPAQPIESCVWIAMTGIAQEVAAAWDHEIVIVDRPILDVWGYARVAHPALIDAIRDPNVKLLRDVIAAWIQTYDLIVESVLDPRVQIEDDQTRNLDPDFRVAVAAALNETYAEFGVSTQLFFRGEHISKVTTSLDLIMRASRNIHSQKDEQRGKAE